MHLIKVPTYLNVLFCSGARTLTGLAGLTQVMQWNSSVSASNDLTPLSQVVQSFTHWHFSFAGVLDPNLSYKALNVRPRRAGYLDCAGIDLARTTFVCFQGDFRYFLQQQIWPEPHICMFSRCFQVFFAATDLARTAHLYVLKVYFAGKSPYRYTVM